MSDSSIELLAYSASNTLADLEEKLAGQIFKYLTMACGGELRHAPGRAQRRWKPKGKKCIHVCDPKSETDKQLLCCTHEHSPECCTHNCKAGAGCCTHTCAPWNCIAAPDGCKCAHKHRGAHPGRGYLICPDGIVGCTVKKCEHRVCTSKCCSHKCTKNCCTHKLHCPPEGCSVTAFVPSERLKPYFKRTSSGNRCGAWKDWLALVAKEGSDMLLEAAEVFNNYTWGATVRGTNPGYGGPSWGAAAMFAYEYHIGKMSKRSFIDRCWTLQHNGGCIFNKFYRGLKALERVLEIQAKQPYEKLIPFASPYVSGLYTQIKRHDEAEKHKDRLVKQLSTTVRSLT